MLCLFSDSLRIQPFLLAPRCYGRFASDKDSIDLHTCYANQCLHNKSGCHGVPNVNLFDFMFLQVNYGFIFQLFCERASEKLRCLFSKEEYILGILSFL